MINPAPRKSQSPQASSSAPSYPPDFLDSPSLEAAVLALGERPLHPAVGAVKKRSGFLNMLRNQRNRKTTEIESALGGQ